MYFNLHTHHATSTDAFVIQNIYKDFDQLPPAAWYSAGLHPWYINDNNWRDEMELLKKCLQQNNVLAVGECGLDKICDTDFNLQMEVFAAQVQAANNINKPLIIHCVRAFEEVVQLLKTNNNKVPVIFHGFNRNAALAKRLVNKGYYLSFGKGLQQPALRQLLNTIPLSNIFFETDDASVSIESIYTLAANALHTGLVVLKENIMDNFRRLFPGVLKVP